MYRGQEKDCVKYIEEAFDIADDTLYNTIKDAAGYVCGEDEYEW